MSDDALFDVFDQEEPTAIVELSKTDIQSNEKRTRTEDEPTADDLDDPNNKRTRTEFIGEPTPVK